MPSHSFLPCSPQERLRTQLQEKRAREKAQAEARAAGGGGGAGAAGGAGAMAVDDSDDEIVEVGEKNLEEALEVRCGPWWWWEGGDKGPREELRRRRSSRCENRCWQRRRARVASSAVPRNSRARATCTLESVLCVLCGPLVVAGPAQARHGAGRDD